MTHYRTDSVKIMTSTLLLVASCMAAALVQLFLHMTLLYFWHVMLLQYYYCMMAQSASVSQILVQIALGQLWLCILTCFLQLL